LIITVDVPTQLISGHSTGDWKPAAPKIIVSDKPNDVAANAPHEIGIRGQPALRCNLPADR
jgi:hypothetical protein